MEIERIVDLLKQTTNDKVDLNARITALENLKKNVLSHWNSNNTMGDNVAPDLLGLVASPVPKEFKVALLDCCAAFAKTAPSTALVLWNKLELLIPFLNKNGMPTTNLTGWNSGIIADLGDIEPRAQEYKVTISFLTMLNNILDHIAKYCMLQSPHLQHSVSLDTCVNLVTNIVFLKINSRQFNNIAD